MTDARLLSDPDWQCFSDRDLRKAVGLAKQQGRTTARLIGARCEEFGYEFKLPSFQTYLDHCIAISKEGETFAVQWHGLPMIEVCNDPRVYWFCSIYERERCHLLKIEPTVRSMFHLQEDVNIWLRVVADIQRSYFVKQMLLPIVSPNKQREMIAAMDNYEREFQYSVQKSMLCLMRLNARADEFVAG